MSASVITKGVDLAGIKTPWHGMPADHSLIVDFFAGGGGASKGIEMALGRSPDIAVNHDAEAIAMHRLNHPETLHLQSDVWGVFPQLGRLIGNRRVGLFHASPDCKHFSKAKGGRPVKRKIRDLAWVVPKFCRRFRPEVVTLENVEEFAGWGPLIQKTAENGDGVFDAEGRPIMVPCKRRKGETFQQWVAAMQRLGYRVDWRERRASGDGAPTIRKRLFVIARCDNRPIVWPDPTHGDPKSVQVKDGTLKPWRTAAECIDWSLPCPSIFATAAEVMAEHGIRVKRPLADKTMARIAKGIKRFVIDAKDPFIVNLTHVGGDRLEGIGEPFRTVTGAHRGEKAIVIPSVTRFNSGAVGSRIDEPLPTVTANSFIKRAGGAAPLGLVNATVMGPFVAGVGGRMGQSENRDVNQPVQTITAKADSVLVAPVLSQYYGDGFGGDVRASSPSHPLPTQPTENRHAVVTPFIVPRYGERDGQEPRTHAADAPLPTVTPDANAGQVVVPVVTRAQHGGGSRGADEPIHTIEASAKDQNQIVAAHLMTMRDAQKPFNEANKPVHTITAGGARLHLVAAFMAKHFGDTGQRPGSDLSEPVATVTSSDHNALVAAGLVNMRGTAEDQLMPRDVEAPAPTISAGGIHAAATTAFLTKYYGTGGENAVDEPLATITTKERLALCTVMIAGEPWLIVDIGMRMLTPRELYAAQGFPPDYKIKTGIFIENGREVERSLTSTAQVRMCGNSVSPETERALIAANCAHLALERRAA